jgi:cytochrome P450 PksS
MTKQAFTDITSREFKANPFPFYARLRAEEPVYCTRLPDKRRVWLVTRYDDVLASLKDERLVKDRRHAMTPEELKKQPWVPAVFKPLERSMLDVDEPDHRRLRNLVHKAFTPSRIEELRERVQAIANELLDQVEARGRMDLVKQYALPLPLTVILELLGIPGEDRHKFQKWVHAFLRRPTTLNMVLAIPSMMAFMRYLRRLFRERRVAPRDDVVTALVQASEGGDSLSEDELLAMVILLMIAGYETTVNLIASGTLVLLEHPTERERLERNPSLIEPAIEELLRYASPVETATERYAREEVTIGGVTLPRGELVLPVLASANRDEAHFERPDTLDIAREKNKHIAFGLGIHFCLGAPLARLEGQIAVQTLLRRLPRLRLNAAPEALRWRPTFALRGLEALPVAF